LNQNKNTNIIAYRKGGNCPHSQNFGALGLSLFSLMVDPRLYNGHTWSHYYLWLYLFISRSALVTYISDLQRNNI